MFGETQFNLSLHQGYISAGSFSDIMSAQIRRQKDDSTVLQEVVVKVFKDSSELDIVNESRMMKLLKHRHVLEIIGKNDNSQTISDFLLFRDDFKCQTI